MIEKVYRKIHQKYFLRLLTRSEGSAILVAMMAALSVGIASALIFQQSLITEKQTRLPRIKSAMAVLVNQIHQGIHESDLLKSCQPSVPNCKLINHAKLDQLQVPLVGAVCDPGVTPCGFLVANRSYDSTTQIFSAQIVYQGKELAVAPVSFSVTLVDSWKSQTSVCPSSAPLLISFSNDGAPNCQALPMDCGSGKYVKSVDPMSLTGPQGILCGDLPQSLSCPPGQFITDFSWTGEANFNIQCAPPINPFLPEAFGDGTSYEYASMSFSQSTWPSTTTVTIPLADCAGSWSACDPMAGTEIFTVTQMPQNGGAACPASPRNCAVDCVGAWGACNAGSQTYAWSITPKNGGAACPYANGATDASMCGGPFATGVCNLAGINAHCGLGCTVIAPPCTSGILASLILNNGNCGTTSRCNWTCRGTGGGADAFCSKTAVGCFTAGTKITMADGTFKDIEDVQVGDLLKGSVGKNRVKALKRYQHQGDLYSVNRSRPFVTAGHPFRTLRGWAAFDEHLAKQLNPNLEIVRLEIGDTLILEHGKVELSEYYTIDASTTVYNFEVSGTRDYHADGFLVHNK